MNPINTTGPSSLARSAQSASPAVTTRSFDLARTGANVHETILTPAAVRARGIKRLFSLTVPGDARGCEAQPLIVPGLMLPNGAVHDVVFLATMANQVFAFDANDGEQLWERTLGQPINGSEEIDDHTINDHWGIISTPVIDLAAGVLYACAWISADGDLAERAILPARAAPRRRLADAGSLSIWRARRTIRVTGRRSSKFRSAERKQRAALALTGGAVLIPFGTIQETAATARGWLIAVDTKSWTIGASWCSTARGSGGGIWHSGAGPAVDAQGFIYVVTGNGDFDGVTDFGESIVKLRYTPPATGRAGALAVVDWWTPWTDDGRTGGNPEGAVAMAMTTAKPRPSNFRLGPHLARLGMMPMGMATGEWSDQDFGSGGPVLAPGGTLLVAGKDGILYTASTSSLGKTTPADLEPAKVAANYAKLKAPPIFYTYYPGPAPSAEPENVETLNIYFAQRTHHLHGTPVLWQSAAARPDALLRRGKRQSQGLAAECRRLLHVSCVQRRGRLAAVAGPARRHARLDDLALGQRRDGRGRVGVGAGGRREHGTDARPSARLRRGEFRGLWRRQQAARRLVGQLGLGPVARSPTRSSTARSPGTESCSCRPTTAASMSTAWPDRGVPRVVTFSCGRRLLAQPSRSADERNLTRQSP